MLEIITTNEELPQAIRESWPALSLRYRSQFYSIYACSLSCDVTEQQQGMLTGHRTFDTIVDYSHHINVLMP